MEPAAGSPALSAPRTWCLLNATTPPGVSFCADSFTQTLRPCGPRSPSPSGKEPHSCQVAVRGRRDPLAEALARFSAGGLCFVDQLDILYRVLTGREVSYSPRHPHSWSMTCLDASSEGFLSPRNRPRLTCAWPQLPPYWRGIAPFQGGEVIGTRPPPPVCQLKKDLFQRCREEAAIIPLGSWENPAVLEEVRPAAQPLGPGACHV